LNRLRLLLHQILDTAQLYIREIIDLVFEVSNFFSTGLNSEKKDKYFIRAFATHEDAGDSYDPYFTAQKMIEASSSNDAWDRAYRDWWERNNSFNKLKALGMSQDNFQQWQKDNKMILDDFHKQAQEFASSSNRTFGITDFYQPGTPEI
jgi:iron complex outermembrane receptor protein